MYGRVGWKHLLAGGPPVTLPSPGVVDGNSNHLPVVSAEIDPDQTVFHRWMSVSVSRPRTGRHPEWPRHPSSQGRATDVAARSHSPVHMGVGLAASFDQVHDESLHQATPPGRGTGILVRLLILVLALASTALCTQAAV